MNVRAIVLSVALVLGLLAPPIMADAQQAGKIPTIGYLAQFSGPAGPPSASIKAFLDGLQDLGYVDGKTIAIEYRYTEGKSDRLPDLAAELARLKVDVIVTETGTAALHAKKATQTIPIVMQASADAVTQGLVASLERPGGNVTGLTALSPAVSGKRLQLLAEVVPKLTKVGVLWSGGPAAEPEWAETRSAAQPLKVQLHSLKVPAAADFPAAFAEAAQQDVQALLLFDVGGMLTTAVAAQLADLAVKHHLPIMGWFPRFADWGNLMGYGVNGLALCRRAATYVDRILKGANPAELPVEPPTKFELAINLKAAKAIDLTIPQSVLSQADRVIE